MSEKPILIGFQGKAGSGKDTFANMMMDNCGIHVIPHRVAFADVMKRVVSELYGVELEAFYDREKKEIKLDVSVSEDRLSPRDIMQHFGTEIVRNMDEDFWVKRMSAEVARVLKDFNMARWAAGAPASVNSSEVNRLSQYNYTYMMLERMASEEYSKYYGSSSTAQVVLIPDVRFPNEQEYILENGGYLIEIQRGESDVGEMNHEHASETSLNDSTIEPHFIIHNDAGLSKLFTQSISILNHLGLR